MSGKKITKTDRLIEYELLRYFNILRFDEICLNAVVLFLKVSEVMIKELQYDKKSEWNIRQDVKHAVEMFSDEFKIVEISEDPVYDEYGEEIIETAEYVAKTWEGTMPDPRLFMPADDRQEDPT